MLEGAQGCSRVLEVMPKADDLTSCASSRMGILLLTASRDAMPASICRAEAMGTMCGASSRRWWCRCDQCAPGAAAASAATAAAAAACPMRRGAAPPFFLAHALPFLEPLGLGLRDPPMFLEGTTTVMQPFREPQRRGGPATWCTRTARDRRVQNRQPHLCVLSASAWFGRIHVSRLQMVHGTMLPPETNKPPVHTGLRTQLQGL